MGGTRAGSIRGRRGRLSIWRVPNFLLEPRGNYLIGRDALLVRLNTFRSVAGAVIVIGMIIHYSALAHTGFTWGGTTTTAATIENSNTAEGAWFDGIIVTIAAAICVVPVVALILVLTAERGSRMITLYQMRWLALSFVSFAAFSAAIGLLLGGGYHLLKPLESSKNVLALIAVALLTGALLVLGVVWIVKSLHLIATGLFRADDAHPLLAPVSVVPIAWATSIIMYVSGARAGLHGVPNALAMITAFGGAISVTILSAITIIRLRRNQEWPFRRGLAGQRVAPGIP